MRVFALLVMALATLGAVVFCSCHGWTGDGLVGIGVLGIILTCIVENQCGRERCRDKAENKEKAE